ncbi:TonB-dependent receptor [Chitinophaga lutea]|uniref:TonB-dependent receptor n=1 Tax=Chitinophaga lutea TaxID=2488634 RepID=A0A3N4PJE8_9BACT|nr:outer membrane beta-barrel family protein [Chitinophaga lutea]RPE08792.1 TonB-dependent receptor [Chitinophaga lutea]
MKTTKIRVFLLLMYVTTYVNNLQAQNPVQHYAVKGRLSGQGALQEVVIQLLHPAGKKLVKVEYADSAGNFTFDRIPAGNYIITTQSMGFARYESAPFSHQQHTQLGTIALQPLTTTLREAAVTANRPFIQQRYDKTVLNVSASISAAGSSALEVLEKAPGITIDQNDNIAMRGRQGVQVMIDGKLVPMSGQDLANMLRSMSASQIETIDLITNPSAKYDAAGNSGIIDIRLKKGKSTGTNGNITLSAGQGVYPKLNPSFNFNSKHKKLNVFASYSYNYRRDFNDLTIYRDFYNNKDEITGSINYDNYFKLRVSSHNARVGADYNINRDITVGVSANGIFTNINVGSNSVAQSYDAQHQQTGSFTTLGNNSPARNNGSLNLNYKHTLDTTGRELTADLDYARFSSGELQDYHTAYFDLNMQPSRQPYVLFGDLNGDLRIKSVKADYTQPLRRIGARLEAGLKSSWVTSDNDVKFYNRSNGGDVLDPGKSNQFIYEENINAAYLNASKKWKKLSLQLGLRVENTNASGLQVTTNETFDRNYTQLFPSGYVGYAFNEQHDLGLSLSRRINRPSYRQLNPFKVFLDPLTSSSGNPFINAETTQSVELTHTFRQLYTTKVGFSRTKDNILMVLAPDAEPNSVLQTFRNLALYDYYNISLSVPVTVGKWLSSTNNVVAYYGHYKGNVVNTDLNVSRVAFNINSSNTVTLNPNTSMEVIGTYQSRSYYGFLDVDGYWAVNVGAQRQLWKKKASLKLNVSDVFFTNKTRAVTRLTGYGERFFQLRDTRVLTLSFTYKFGGSQPGARRRTGGAEDEKRRAG